MDADPRLALCIARFSVPDRAAVDSLRAALRHGDRCIVVLRDAFMARSARCPLTWEERAEMLKAALAAHETDQPAIGPMVQATQFVPLREHYDEDRTLRALQALIDSAFASGAPT